MDSFWIYLIIGVLYGLSKLLGKKTSPEDSETMNAPSRPNTPPASASRPSTTTTTSSPGKALTFEELLREISEEKSKPARPAPTYVDYDDDLEEEARDLEDVKYDYKKKDNIYKVYEDAKQQAFQRASLEETLKVESTNVEYGKFKAFQDVEKRDLMKEYLSDFNDPEGLKKALVMSEVLKRKF